MLEVCQVYTRRVLHFLLSVYDFFFCVCVCHSELQKKPVEGFSAGLIDDDNIFEWEVMIIGPPDTF